MADETADQIDVTAYAARHAAVENVVCWGGPVYPDGWGPRRGWWLA